MEHLALASLLFLVAIWMAWNWELPENEKDLNFLILNFVTRSKW